MLWNEVQPLVLMIRNTAIRLVTASAAVMAAAFAVIPVEAREPQWQKSRGLCGQLRADGWKGSPEGPGDPATGEMRHGSIFVCRLRQLMPAQAGGKPARVDVFMQQGGGDNLTVIAEVWTAADQAPTLVAAASMLGRAARELEIALPGDMLENVMRGEPWEDVVAGLRFDIRKTTRESELVGRPDAKPGDVPLVEFKVSVEPAS